MDPAFLRFSVGLHLVFRQFRAQPKQQSSSQSKRGLHHSAMHPLKGHGSAVDNYGGGGAGGDADMIPAGSPPARASLLVVSSDVASLPPIGPSTKAGPSGKSSSSGTPLGKVSVKAGAGGSDSSSVRAKRRDFLHVYYLDAALSYAGNPGTGIVGGPAAVELVRRLQQQQLLQQQIGGGNGDDACLLHQRFNLTFAETFGTSKRTLQARDRRRRRRRRCRRRHRRRSSLAARRVTAVLGVCARPAAFARSLARS